MDDGTSAARVGISPTPVPRQSDAIRIPRQTRSYEDGTAGEVARVGRPHSSNRRRDVGVEVLAALAAGLVVAVSAGGQLPLLAVSAVVVWCVISYQRFPALGGPLSRQLKPLAVNAAVLVAVASLLGAVGVVAASTQPVLVLAVSAAAAAASALRVLRIRRAGAVRAIVVGDLMEIARWLDAWSDRRDLQVVGAILVEPEPDTDILPRDLLGVPIGISLVDLPARVGQWQADLVAFAPGFGLSQADVRRGAWALKDSQAKIAVTGQFDGIAPHRITPGVVGGETVCEVATPGPSGGKRMLDVVVSLLALVALAPVLLLIALLVKSDGGPALFAQVRTGLNGRPFRMLKFRSMRLDAEELGTWTTEADPRVTRLGRFLRCTSMDELPQLVNVLRGDMSIVGPRPEQPRYVTTFSDVIPNYLERHRVKTGITGWAQVNGLRGDTSILERTRADLWYTENSSLLLDIKIMVRTAATLFFAKNAY